jgi:hypothetical protein
MSTRRSRRPRLRLGRARSRRFVRLEPIVVVALYVAASTTTSVTPVAISAMPA